MRALVDADGLIYLAGFGVEKTRYQVVLEHSETGVLKEEWFNSVSEIKEYLKEEPLWVEVDRHPDKTVEPLEFALSICKQKLQHIQDTYGPLEVYIRAVEQNNFRDKIATIHPYKGNRSNLKPTHHDAIREYLKVHWGAIEIHDQEVDDEIGCRITELEGQGQPYIVCSPDKDLDQLHGPHWNYRDNTFYEVDPAEAKRWFWIQVLSGDYSDNVRGCWKVGQKYAEEWVDQTYAQRYTEGGRWKGVCRLYEESMGKPACPYAGMPPELVALENAQLVYMRRKRGEIWQPPGTPNTQEEVGPALDS